MIIEFCLCADPLLVYWTVDGCVTKQRGEKHTECHCNHLTYFTVLVVRHARDTQHNRDVQGIHSHMLVYEGVAALLIVCVPSQQLEPRPVRHLLALTAITSLGCAVSVISCVALIVYLCRKR